MTTTKRTKRPKYPWFYYGTIQNDPALKLQLEGAKVSVCSPFGFWEEASIEGKFIERAEIYSLDCIYAQPDYKIYIRELGQAL